MALDERFLIDFRVFMQAVAHLTAGLDPYAGEGFFSPPWIFYFVSPFSLLPTQMATAAWFLVNLGALVTCIGLVLPTHRYRPLWIIALALSPVVWPYLFFGNIIGLAGIGLIGLFHWKHPWLALPLALLKPQLSLVTIIVWAVRTGWKNLVMAAGFLLVVNAPLFVWRPTLYGAFLRKALSGQYLETEWNHITAATSWLPRGSAIWLVASLALIVVLILLSLRVKGNQVTLISTILADPVASGGEYGLLAAAAAMGEFDPRNIAVIAVTVFALPLLALFIRGGDLLLPLATALLLGWAILSERSATSRSPGNKR